MKRYYRIMLGKGSIFAADCFAHGYIGGGFGGIGRDVSQDLAGDYKTFSERVTPEMQALNPGKSKVSIGVWRGFAWTIGKKIERGDVVLCPDGEGNYRVGEVTGPYFYVDGTDLPHRRPVTWLSNDIRRSDMSEPFRFSCGAIGTVAEVSKYEAEIATLLGSQQAPTLIATDPEVEDVSSFALEKHLEEFLVQNWSRTELGKTYDLYEEDGEVAGQQYPTETGPIDILALSKDKKFLLVVELKKGRASDAVVGQVLRYMGCVQEELAEDGQEVRGVIIAATDDSRIRRALAMVRNVEFYRYEVSFRLVKN